MDLNLGDVNRVDVNSIDVKQMLATELEAVRRRSLDLLEPVSEEDLLKQHSPIMSPLVWDLAHVGNYEEIWLLRMIAGVPSADPELDDIYDAFKHVRKDRPKLKLLDPAQARTYIGDVRGRVFDVLEQVDFDTGNPLLREGFVYRMVVQHEHQHDETMLATLELRDGREYPVLEASSPQGRALTRKEVLVDGGPFKVGTDLDPWAYDNERPCHNVDLPPYYIDTAPVSNADFMAFIAEGGYEDRRWWSERGWEWKTTESATQPLFWTRQGPGQWTRIRFGRSAQVPPNEPVQHVSWFEAEAYAAWAGKRLPTEIEWEKAASWDPGVSRKRHYPWGDAEPDETKANIGQHRFHPTEIGAYPEGASAYGCEQMIGDVWEWTTSDFTPYPGFASFPYREYSEVFYGGGYKVLRGGSWATHHTAIRNTFRNWDYPNRRQIFCGFRCARDA